MYATRRGRDADDQVDAIGGAAPSSIAQDDATRYRFGGTENDFTDKYGEPTKTVDLLGREDTSVLTYSIFGFQEVSTVVYDGKVIGMTLRPVDGDTWTTQAAQVVLNDFAPADAEYDDVQVPLGQSDTGNQIALQGTSDGLSEEIEQEIYDEFEAEGEPGTFYAILYEVGTNQYSGLSINLGTAEAASAGDSVAEEAEAATRPITVSGAGTTVSENFTLPEGRYRVNATVEVATQFGFDGFIIYFYDANGGESLLFNELIDQNGTWTGSTVLNNPESGEVFVSSENTESAWVLEFEPF